jgi:hypothetical protein
MLTSASAEADATWASWGMPLSAPAELRLYNGPAEDGPVVARATPGSNVVYITREYRDRVWATANDSSYDMEYRIGALSTLYAVLTHERGHNMGLEHTESGIMRAAEPESPARGFTWAYNWIKSRRQHNARRRALKRHN